VSSHAIAALVAEARRLEPRVGRTSTHTGEDFKTVLVIETAGLTTAEVGALSDAFKAFRRRSDLAAEFVIVNATGGEFVPRVPSRWPP
jgi:HAMP domain-containing protein